MDGKEPLLRTLGEGAALISGRRATLLMALGATGLVIALVAVPDVAFQGALKGLKLWWEVVFPALLPFFVGGQILMGLGVVHAMGVLLEPFMRPLFNLPGIGGFVTAMGLASGYPIGAVLTARLRRQGEITPAEGERLMSFANTADPLFMAGAVAVAMFGNRHVAGILMSAHYLGALVTGFVMRFHKPDAPISPPPAPSREPLLARMQEALLTARQKDGRPFGQVLGDSVRDSVQTLLLIGGFIMVFSVIIDLLVAAKVVAAMGWVLAPLLRPLGLEGQLAPSLMAGLFEITLGTQLSSEAAAPLVDRLVVASAIIGWAGLSVHAQVAALTEGTGINIAPYIMARFIHAVVAGALVPLLMGGHIPTAAWLSVPDPGSLPLGSGFLGWGTIAAQSTARLAATVVVAGAVGLALTGLQALLRTRVLAAGRRL